MTTYTSWSELPLALSVDMVAHVLGISRSNAYILIHRKDFPSVRIGEKRWIVPRDALKAWLEQEIEKQIKLQK